MFEPAPSRTYADFSGGLTDNLFSQDLRSFQYYDNLFISPESKPVERPGSEFLNITLNSTVKALGATGNLFNYRVDTALIVRGAGTVYTTTGAAWVGPTTPNSNAAFPQNYPGDRALTDQSIATYSEWNAHGLMSLWDPTVTNSVTGYPIYGSPLKFFTHTDGTTIKLQNLGIKNYPDNIIEGGYATILANAITLANAIKSKVNVHYADSGKTFTITIASPGVITCNSHGYQVGEKVAFQTTGALPTGLTAGNWYWVTAVTANTFEVNSSGTGAINTSGSQSGTHSIKMHKATPSAIATANASDETTLVTLTQALMTSLDAHLGDATVATGGTVTTYHYVDGAATNTFGSWCPRANPLPTTLLECVPRLNELKRLFNWHLRAFSYTAVMNLIHPEINETNYASTYKISTADVSISSTPTFSTLGTALTDIYTTAESVRTGIITHIEDAVNHISVNYDYGCYFPHISDADTFMIGWAKCIAGYSSHRTNNTVHGGTESGTTLLTTTTPNESVSGNREYAFDLSSGPDASDSCTSYWTRVYTILKDIFAKATLHTAQGATRHTAASSFTYSDASPTYTFGNFAVALFYKNTYTTSEGIEFTDIGAPLYTKTGPLVVTSGSNYPFSIAWASLTALTTNDNWPAPTATIEGYRTTNDGTTYYKSFSVPSSGVSGSYYDYLSDTELAQRQTLYTTGGVYPNQQPPKCRAIVVVENVAWFGGIVEHEKGIDVPHPRRIRNAIESSPGAAPTSFFKDLEQDFIGWGVAKDNLVIALTEKGVFRIEGSFDERGRGGINPVKIDASVGGVSQNGGVSFNDLFYFAGKDGFYVTDGFKVQLLSKHITTTYAAYVSTAAKRRSIKATVDRLNRRIVWAVQAGSTGYNDTLITLEIDHSTPERGAFTRHSNGVYFAPTAVEYFGGVLYRGDYQGFVFKHTATLLSDPDISRGGSGSLPTGSTRYIPWQLRTVADNLDYPADRKWITRSNFEFNNLGNLSVLARSINEVNTANVQSLQKIRFRQTYAGVIRERRTFPKATDSTKTAGGLRALRKQIDLTPASVAIINSDDTTVLTKATSTGSTVNLSATVYSGGASSYTWPSDPIGWVIAFDTDNYVTEYPITARASNTALTVTGTPAATAAKWVLRGIPKDERAHILGVTIRFAVIGDDTQGPTGVDGDLP